MNSARSETDVRQLTAAFIAQIAVFAAFGGVAALDGAAWIGAPGNVAPALSRAFEVRGPVKCASLVMAAPGYCEAQLDGRKVGDRMFDPPPADFTKRVYASELPLELAPGRHELTVLLGHGRLDQRASSAWDNDRDKWRMEPCLKEALVEAVRRAEGRFRGGVIGSKHVFRALSRAGRSDLAFDMLTKRGSPGFMHWREEGGTALWEDWWGGFSRNHVMFADFACWAYQWLGGLRLAEATGSTAAVPVPEKSGMGSVVVAPDCMTPLSGPGP